MLNNLWELLQAAALLFGIGIYLKWLAYNAALGWRKGISKVPTNVNINFINEKNKNEPAQTRQAE